jgi:hypothetical protein
MLVAANTGGDLPPNSRSFVTLEPPVPERKKEIYGMPTDPEKIQTQRYHPRGSTSLYPMEETATSKPI